MKGLYIISIAFVLFGCAGDTDRVRSFIPGMYVKEIQDEFSVGMDTLVITTLDELASTYRIERRTRFQQRLDGKILRPKYSLELWTAVYHKNTGQLMEQQKGKVFTFYPNLGKLSMGSSEYTKTTSP